MNYDGYENGYSNMRLAVKEKEGYMYAPNYQVCNEVETYEKKAFTSAEAEKTSYMRQAMRQRDDDYTFVPNRVFNDFETKNKVCGTAEAAMGYSNMRQTQDNQYTANRMYADYETNDKVYGTAEAAMGYSNMRQTQDNQYTANRMYAEYETNDKVYTTAQIAKVPSIVRQVVSYGPWGGNGGMHFDDGRYTGVREIHLGRTGGLVSLRVCYDNNGQSVWGNKNGGSAGVKIEKIVFEYPSEYLTHITGYYGSIMLSGSSIVKSITFHTNKKKYGPFGDEQGIPFSSASKDGIIVGFHGKQGWVMHSIGVHVLERKPSPPLPPTDVDSRMVKAQVPCGPGVFPAGMVKKPAPYGPYGPGVLNSVPAGPLMVKEPAPCGLGPWGGDGGKPWDDGVFTGIKKIFLTKGQAIYSIQFEFDCNGQSMWSNKHGGGNEGTSHLIQFQYPHEILTCISGYYGSVAGDECKNVIKSLTFYTNRGRYGPYGEETGTCFTSTKTEGRIIGFYGRAACCLYAIGVHVQPSLSDRVSREPKGYPPNFPQFQFNIYQ